jgi:hypothetical protein
MTRAFFLLLAILCSPSSGQQLPRLTPASTAGDSKSSPAAPPPSSSALRTLATLKTVKASVSAGSFGFPLKCDQAGDLYLRNEIDGVPGLHKLNPNGKEIGAFLPRDATPAAKIARAGYFSMARDGSLYQYVSSWDKPHYMVYAFWPNGTLRSKVVLQVPFPWTPAQVAVFPSGDLLVTGLEYDADQNAAKWPFTGLFSSSGALLKEIKIEDDGAIHDMAEVGDARVTSPEAPGTNRAVGLGQVDLASDGNIYVLRRLSPAILYAVSSAGEVVRRFTVDAGQPDYMPNSMHIAGNRIAVQLAHPQNGDQIIKVVDLEGHELETYHVERASSLGYAIACYAANPDRFTFLGESEDGRLTLNVAGPH